MLRKTAGGGPLADWPPRRSNHLQFDTIHASPVLSPGSLTQELRLRPAHTVTATSTYSLSE